MFSCKVTPILFQTYDCYGGSFGSEFLNFRLQMSDDKHWRQTNTVVSVNLASSTTSLVILPSHSKFCIRICNKNKICMPMMSIETTCDNLLKATEKVFAYPSHRTFMLGEFVTRVGGTQRSERKWILLLLVLTCFTLGR